MATVFKTLSLSPPLPWSDPQTLEEDFSVETAVEFGRIYKRNGQWKFEAIGMGQKGGLQEYLNKYQ